MEAAARWLGLPNEQKLIGHGLTSCATCDGAFLPQRANLRGGRGVTPAAEEALFLTRFASKVYLIHRRDTLRASKIMTARVLEHPKIEPVWDSKVTEYLTTAEGEMRAVRLQNLLTGAEDELAVACVFVAIGHEPNTKAFAGKTCRWTRTVISSKPRAHPRVCPTGGISLRQADVSDKVYRQAIWAAGDGCAAALDAERYLTEHAEEHDKRSTLAC